MVRVVGRPRLHCTLIDLGHATPRAYGGCGFVIDGPSVEVQATEQARDSIHAGKVVDLRAINDLRRTVSRFRRLVTQPRALLALDSATPQHVGLGSKTVLLLSALTALNLLAGSPLPHQQLQRLSGRGGASGVGVNGFFQGGFLADSGHAQSDIKGFLPSSARRPSTIPNVTCRLPIPASWRFHVFLPSGHAHSGRAERRFFREATPIPRLEVLRTLSETYHGIVPAVASADIPLLARSLANIHAAGFKRRELDGQPAAVKSLIRQLSRLGNCAVGMSSMGPTVYAVTDVSSDLAASFARVAARQEVRYLGEFRGWNRGFVYQNE